MSPEPDLVASTKSSSGSDKSNSLPRTAQESSPPDLPSIEISSQPQISVSEAFPGQHLPPSEPPKEEQPPEPPPMVPIAVPIPSPAANSHLADENCQPSVGISTSSIGHVQTLTSRTATLTAHAPPLVAQTLPQVSPGPPRTSSVFSSACIVPVAPPRRRRRNRLNTDDVSNIFLHLRDKKIRALLILTLNFNPVFSLLCIFMHIQISLAVHEDCIP